MVQACRRPYSLSKFAVNCLGWGYSVDSLAIAIGLKRAGRTPDPAKVAHHLHYTLELHEALTRGGEAERSPGFDSDTIITGNLYRAWQDAIPKWPILGEKTPHEVIKLLYRFDDLEESELSWLFDYLSQIGELMILLGP